MFIWAPMGGYGHMSTEQARFEMTDDEFEAWVAWNRREPQ
jgi:hypothetical protein